MADEVSDASDGEKETLLTETINELKNQLQALSGKKTDVQQRLDDIKSKLEVTQEEEHKTEARMKDIINVEAKLEELMNEEERLLREKSSAEDDMLKIKEKFDKIKQLNRKIEGEDDN